MSLESSKAVKSIRSGSRKYSIDSHHNTSTSSSASKSTRGEVCISKYDGFRDILYKYIREPTSNFQDICIFRDERFTLIVDAFPKAQIHLLLIPSDTFLPVKTLGDLEVSHAHRLMQLHLFARNVESSIRTRSGLYHSLPDSMKSSYYGQYVSLGYHLVPSLHPLHIHIISSDMISPFLKTKKHWNSFTSKYFVSIDLVESMLGLNIDHISVSAGRELSELLSDKTKSKSLLLSDIHCHKCKMEFSTISDLKSHLLRHMEMEKEKV